MEKMKAISLFSGIGGFDLGFVRAGFEIIDQVEIDKACQNVLRNKLPGANIYDDTKTYTPNGTIDAIFGGFPCQDLSIAGKREGLAGERSGLWFEFHRIIEVAKPGWVIIENVPGLLSSNGGRDFAVILRGLVKCGYGVAWRVLDAQYFGVAQRRRRVFVVGHLGDGRAAEVLFEREGSCRDTPPSREAGARVARNLTRGPSSGYRYDPNGEEYITETLPYDYYKQGGNGMGEMQNGIIAFSAKDNGRDAGEISPPLVETRGHTSIAYNIQHNDGGEHKRKDRPNGGLYVNETETALTVGSTDLTAVAWQNRQQSGEIRLQGDTVSSMTKQWGTGGNNVPFVGVRRLTPTECERLQGFPDGWTDGQSDSARYRQLGNAVCVPVAEWIAKRINS